MATCEHTKSDRRANGLAHEWKQRMNEVLRAHDKKAIKTKYTFISRTEKYCFMSITCLYVRCVQCTRCKHIGYIYVQLYTWSMSKPVMPNQTILFLFPTFLDIQFRIMPIRIIHTSIFTYGCLVCCINVDFQCFAVSLCFVIVYLLFSEFVLISHFIFIIQTRPPRNHDLFSTPPVSFCTHTHVQSIVSHVNLFYSTKHKYHFIDRVNHSWHFKEILLIAW